MEVNTPIAEDVIAAEYKSNLDAACKRLLAYKLILAHILKHTLPEEYIEKGTEKTLLANIRSLIETLQITAEQAMNALRVPAEDRGRLLAQM